MNGSSWVTLHEVLDGNPFGLDDEEVAHLAPYLPNPHSLWFLESWDTCINKNELWDRHLGISKVTRGRDCHQQMRNEMTV